MTIFALWLASECLQMMVKESFDMVTKFPVMLLLYDIIATL